jgi:cell division protein FtsB
MVLLEDGKKILAGVVMFAVLLIIVFTGIWLITGYVVDENTQKIDKNTQRLDDLTHRYDSMKASRGQLIKDIDTMKTDHDILYRKVDSIQRAVCPKPATAAQK